MLVIKRTGSFPIFTNIPWGNHPAKLDVTRSGHLDPDQPADDTEVMDFVTCADSSLQGLGAFIKSDPRNDTPEVLDKAVYDYNRLQQLMAMRTGGEYLPEVAMTQNGELVLDAHKAVQDTAADLRRKVRAPFDGLDLGQMEIDAGRLTFIRKMKLAQSIFTSSLDKADAWYSNGIAQRLYPIFTDALPVVKGIQYLATPLEPLRKLFAGAAEAAANTRNLIADALRKHGVQPHGQGGTPAAGTPAEATPGATPPAGSGTGGGTVTPVLAQGPASPESGHTSPGHTGHGHTTHHSTPKKPGT